MKFRRLEVNDGIISRIEWIEREVAAKGLIIQDFVETLESQC
jgi:hypothetical protein